MIQFSVLRECGPLLSRYDFERECCSRGMNQITYGIYLGRSPVVARYATSLYGLRGADIVPGDIDRLAPRISRTPLVYDYGWSADARPWVLLELSRGVISTGVLSIPSSVRDLLEGRYVLYAEDRSRLGTLVVAKQACWGLGPLFKRRGGEPGDILLLHFNLQSREVEAQMGIDRSLLEENLNTRRPD